MASQLNHFRNKIHLSPVYRSLGNILLEVEDRDSLLEELKSAEKALTEHLTRLAEREESIREKYEEMAEQFEME